MNKEQAIYILTLMKDYEYGHPALEEKEALDYAIQAIKDLSEEYSNKPYICG